MSENRPAPKDRTTLYIAIVGAVATISAAFIGVLPTLVNRNAPTPVPIVITATPAPTQAALATATTQATLPPPTATTEATVVPATSTSIPPTTVLTVTDVVSPTITTPIPPLPTTNNVVTLFVVNNLPQAMEFFVDGASRAKINSGIFTPLKLPPGTRELKQCILGADYSVPTNCFAKEYAIATNPDVWEMFDPNNPLTTQTDINLLVLNRANIPQDVYVDNRLVETIQPRDFTILQVTPGPHTIQSCAVGFAPPNGACGQPVPGTYRSPTHYFFINGDAS